MKSLVSVIIPVYNKDRFLDKSLSKLLNQTYESLEIIIINDGSKDKSEDIILEYQAKDNRIRYISQENQGVARARNIGLEQARGEYVTFLDPDDFYEEIFIEKMLNTIGSNLICYCGHYLLESTHRRKAPITFKENDIIVEYLLNRTNPSTNSWLIRREFIEKYELRFEENLDWGEDILFFSELLTLTTSISACKEYLTYYNVQVDNALSTNNIDKIDKDIYCMQQYEQFLCSIQVPSSKKRAILRAIYGYRLPALVTYRLLLNKQQISLDIYEKYKYIMNDMKLINGLRSIKLTVYKFKLDSYVKRQLK